jgi:choline dehydrogenase-like flavoprotein
LSLSADVAIVGSGISGMLVARECLRAGLEVVVLERGDLREHAWQLVQRRYEADVEGARHNHETAPGSPAYPWDYLYAVGGASLHWSGHAPRLQPVDLRMASAYGVMEDWPLAYEELEPYYERAEAALHVAGAPAPRHGREGGQPAHPLSPMDRLVAPHLDPYLPLPQARPSRPTGAAPACCGAATCDLCPVDSRFSVLNGLRDVLGHPALRLLTQTVAARVRLGPRGRAASLEAVGPGREPVQVAARAFVLAASGFENPAILLRSGLDRPATGRYLYDHAHRSVWVRLRRPVGAGVGDTIATGHTAAFLDGDFRARRSAAIAILFNPGIPVGGTVAEGLAAGRPGAAVREEAADLWSRTLPFDLLLEDVPRPDRQVTLSPRRDSLGLPCVRVRYDAPGPYEESGFAAVRGELARRLDPLGVEAVDERPAPAGGHLLGTCRMGSGPDAVVDPDLRHLDVGNLSVVGGSAMPTYSPAHPTVTIAALAIRAGDRIALELR